jgi:hypothetical protein
MPADDIASRRAVLALAGLTGAAGALGAERALGQQPAPRAPSVPAPTAIDPRTYGAKVDGATDDSAALRTAAETGRAVMIEGQMRIEQPVDLPAGTSLLGAGPFRSLLTLGPKGKLRIGGESFDTRGGGGAIRDLTIRPADRANAAPGLELRHLEHVLFDNVTLYRTGVVLDDHHYLAFRDCRFLGEGARTVLASNCVSQPSGRGAISEAPRFSGCHFQANPVTLEDTVDARFTDCTFLSGPFGIRSIRHLALGPESAPFFMGPTIAGCVFDSIDGPAIDIDGGGTDCRVTGSYISAGRRAGKPGVRLAGCSAVELASNRFEWCGAAGLELYACERIGVVGNSFGNIAGGPAIASRGSRDTRVVANAFENRARWGGSGAGGTTLAIEADTASTGWVVTANTATDLRDPRVAVLGGSLVEANAGWPPATEQGWPAGPTSARPQGIADGYRWYDQTLGRWLHWHHGSGRWRDAAGAVV